MRLKRLKHILNLWGYYGTSIERNGKPVCRICRRFYIRESNLSYNDIKDDLSKSFGFFHDNEGKDKLDAWKNAIDSLINDFNIGVLSKKELEWMSKQGFKNMEGK